MNSAYKEQVRLLIRIMPLIYNIKDFAVHGGTAINLFHKDMPRYSVDIDLTFIPIMGREESIDRINEHLCRLKADIERAVPGIRVVHKPEVWKLQCHLNGTAVKVEVNGTNRGLLGESEELELCQSAQHEFGMTCKARVVSFSQLYGGKIATALGRQHPRDLFDCKYMEAKSFDEVKGGLMLCLLGSDKPILESLSPNAIDQSEALANQFAGMSDIPFSYADYEETRKNLVKGVNECLTESDKAFFVSFEQGTPDWSLCGAGDLSRFPSVKWKQQNILRLKKSNPRKFQSGIEKLREHFGMDRSCP